MTYEQTALFALIVLVLVGLLWGKWRYDIVAFSALLIGVIIGAVPAETAFTGFGHEATIIVALVLVVSAGLSRSGAVDLIGRVAMDNGRSLSQHIAITGSIAGVLSAFMNNVATLALFMPVDIQAAKKAGRSPALTLMPLSFATILGGLVTLIGTPPNIVVAAYRERALGASYTMFDFAPVGAACALVGIAYVALIGWRLIPTRGGKADGVEPAPEDFVAELIVAEGSKAIDEKMRDLDAPAAEHDCAVLGLVRKGKRLPGRARNEVVAEGDILVVLGSAEALEALAGALGLRHQGKSGQIAEVTSEMTLAEVVIARDSNLEGRRANDVYFLRSRGLSLVGLSREGRAINQRIRTTPLHAGDVLLLLGTPEAVASFTHRSGALSLKRGERAVTRHEKAIGAIGLFALAIAAAVMGFVPLPIALGVVAMGFVLFDILPLRDLYDSIEWPVIVLLGSMIPIGVALEETGGTLIIAEMLADVSTGLPAWAAVALVLVVTMTLSDVLNNTATAVVAAPISVQLAQTLGVNPDSFLMAVAVGSSCAFLTPIGHKNNMLILGPGGYRFGDYWRMGLPLEAIVTAVAVPMIMIVWPL
ncbi:SLC13 family permease [Pelagibacterium xiamenense]|uniref:SLC13 family permease n=1 Tax=Pelagibacterium xiamenense TaxID=2901140 RepID=UPI001E527CFA|nr:SLC13 family permease [Pelagibacterium xiamenense]MCD7061259.1 SLC13 family permease [Pelagibacterium xiamenense]